MASMAMQHGLHVYLEKPLAHNVFGARTEGWALGIRGYAFDEFGERLSERALANLAAAAAFIEPLLRAGGGFDRALTDDAENLKAD